MGAERRRQDPYEVLGVNPEAPEEVVRAAYRALAAKYHPDRNPGDVDAELKLKRLNAAYRVLGDPAKRKQYDEMTHSPEADVGAESTPEAPKKEPAPETSRAEPSKPTQPQGNVVAPGGRALLAVLTAGMSLYVNLAYPSTSPYARANPTASIVGQVVGCTALALFIYWLAGRMSPVVCWSSLAPVLGLILVASIAMHDGSSLERLRDSDHVTATTVPRSGLPAFTATPTTVAAPDVPPLLANETPPSDAPNYVEPRELSSGGIVAGFDSCESSARKAIPTLNADVLSSYCTCVVDVTRRNFGATGDVTKTMPSPDQINRCAAAARSNSPSPFAYASPRSTADIWKSWTGCVQNNGGEDHGGYCGCLVDLNTASQAHAHIWADVPGKQTVPQFVAGCQVVDQYWATTKTHLTVRQFKAMVVGAATK
jgi:hypothetical protein